MDETPLSNNTGILCGHIVIFQEDRFLGSEEEGLSAACSKVDTHTGWQVPFSNPQFKAEKFDNFW
jgi:hypothetical protein